MAKVKFEIEFDSKEWKPIKHEGYTSDNNAYRLYRLLIPKKPESIETKKPEPKV